MIYSHQKVFVNHVLIEIAAPLAGLPPSPNYIKNLFGFGGQAGLAMTVKGLFNGLNLPFTFHPSLFTCKVVPLRECINNRFIIPLPEWNVRISRFTHYASREDNTLKRVFVFGCFID